MVAHTSGQWPRPQDSAALAPGDEDRDSLAALHHARRDGARAPHQVVERDGVHHRGHSEHGVRGRDGGDAAAVLGAAVNPVNPVLTSDELEALFIGCNVRVVVAHMDCLPAVEKALVRCRGRLQHGQVTTGHAHLPHMLIQLLLGLHPPVELLEHGLHILFSVTSDL